MQEGPVVGCFGGRGGVPATLLGRQIRVEPKESKDVTLVSTELTHQDSLLYFLEMNILKKVNYLMSEQVTAINKQTMLGFSHKFTKLVFFEAVKDKTGD